MNKLLSLSAVIAMSFMSLNAQANSGTISFEGEIIDSTCTVKVNGGAQNATVVLPTVSKAELATMGDTTGKTSFLMNLENCTSLVGSNLASAYFGAGSSVDATTGRLNNTNDTGAKNVSLQLTDINGVELKAGHEQGTSAEVDLTGGSGALEYAVSYYAEDTVEAGPVASSVTYTIQYK